MKNQILLKENELGGGVIKIPIPQNIVIIRFSNYCRKYFGSEPYNLSPLNRMAGCKVLIDSFAFKKKEVSGLMKISRITAYKDKNSADLFYDRMPDFKKKCDKIEDYIRYFSKYIYL